MTRVRVDFNSRGKNGTVRGSQRLADGPIDIGDRVTLYDPAEDDMWFEATVVDLDEGTGRAVFAVDWEPAVPAVLPGVRFQK